MGNYPTSLSKRQLRDNLAAYITKRDTEFPEMERPCATPGAVYSIIVRDRTLAIEVSLPFKIDAAIPPEAAEVMKKSLHDAILPVVEKFYRDIWEQTLAGKTIDDTGPLPKKWGLLFEKWIRRCWQRGSFATDLIGSRGSASGGTWYTLPDEYKWDHPSRQDLEGWK